MQVELVDGDFCSLSMEREIGWDVVEIVDTVDPIGHGIVVVVIVLVVLDCWLRFGWFHVV